MGFSPCKTVMAISLAWAACGGFYMVLIASCACCTCSNGQKHAEILKLGSDSNYWAQVKGLRADAGMCARRRTFFSCLAKKRRQKKATLLPASLPA
ncbi:hypothetical protein [Extensimonas sp. H3M7-6]|uniref:hypothetical protein n=1 Tax=Extensimonas soli TaxID=3031322 RepID=UPI0023DAE7F2|nr:hypothetical protein [Extensimonas sp. H3M7-6]MDF1482419.1 hypothetical protein [Extensimonas sp. H3M7-6]